MFTGVSAIHEAPAESIVSRNTEIVLDAQLIPELTEPGGSIKFTVMQSPLTPLKIQVSRLNNGELIAYRNHCAHGGRELEYISKKNIIRCVSMGHSKYSLEGKPIGHSNGPITIYPVRREEKKLRIRIV
jgi:nitrite reductase/ring-hydroxylating ferredoxin subunit